MLCCEDGNRARICVDTSYSRGVVASAKTPAFSGPRVGDRYAATSLLAETGLSTVYRAEDLTDGSTVCLKLLKKDEIGRAHV